MALSSCDNDAAILTGDLTGRVLLYNKGALADDQSGVLVSVEGTDKSTVSDEDGSWTITDLPTGTYVLHLTKTGYGEVKEIGYQFVGGGTSYILSAYTLSDVPATRVILDSLTFSRTDFFQLHIWGSSPKPNTERSAIICLSRDSVKLLGAPDDPEMVVQVYLNAHDTNEYFSVIEQIYYQLGRDYFDKIPSGTILFATVRIVGEGKNYTRYSAYYDPTRYRWIYTAAGPASQILKDTVP